MKSIKIRTPELLKEGIYVSKQIEGKSELIKSDVAVCAGTIYNLEVSTDIKKIVSAYKHVPSLHLSEMGFCPDIFVCYWFIEQLEILVENTIKVNIHIYIRSENESVNQYFEYLCLVKTRLINEN